MKMTTQFIRAAIDGRTDILREAQRKDLNAIDEDGMTATLWAAKSGKLEALRMIIGRGGDVDKSDYLGYTALHHAARMGNLDIVSYLINWGCNLFALDNDHHSAMDIASLYDKQEVINLLDAACAQQQSKNPKIVGKLKEDASQNADRNIKRWRKLQDQAAKKAEKEQQKLKALNNDFKPPDSKSIFKSLTMKLRGNTGSRNKLNQSSKYSDMVGIAYGTKSGVARKVQQKRSSGEESSFKVSETDELGKRTVRSVEGTLGIQGSSREVMYVNNRGDQLSGKNSKMALSNIFNGHQNESDILVDSGVDSYFSDHDDDEEEEKPSLWNRPGFGQVFWQPRGVTALQSFDPQTMENGQMENGIRDDDDLPDGLLHSADEDIATRMRDLPWDQEDVENLDDDDIETEFSSLEMFLTIIGLTSYISYFTKEKVDLELLMKMTDNDLKEINLPFGPRKKIHEAVEIRRKTLSNPSEMSDSFL